MENLPSYIFIVFFLILIFAVYYFYKTTNDSKIFLTIILLWILLQSMVSISGFYKITNTFPTRFSFLVIPPFLLILYIFMLPRGRLWIDGLDVRNLTLLHIIRIPIELVLFWLFLNKGVPQLMTFEGRNFDILSGITAPIIFYFCFTRNKINVTLLLFWNFVCLCLLINIVAHAILSIPTPFQKFAFEQPNVALLRFPFVFLPSVLVPLVLFAHIASIRRLITKSNIQFTS